MGMSSYSLSQHPRIFALALILGQLFFTISTAVGQEKNGSNSSVQQASSANGQEINGTNLPAQQGESQNSQQDSSNQTAWWDRDISPNVIPVKWWRLVLGLFIIFFGLLLKKIVESYILNWLGRLFAKTETDYDEKIFEAISKPLATFILIGSLHLAVYVLKPELAGIIKTSYTVAGGLMILWGIYRLIDVLAEFLAETLSRRDKTLSSQFMPLIRQTLRIATLILGTLTILSTVGVDVYGIVAGLGVGGLAIALAAQDTFANFIGAFNILTDRPFKVGDWIQIGDKVDGDVEEIGFRSTKVRTFGNTQLTVPNSFIAKEIVNNWSRMKKRRIKMTIGVTYDTKPEQMRDLLKRIEKVLQDDEGVNQDYMLVKFTDLGPSSLDIFLYYFSKSTVWKEYLELRERINLKIIEIVDEMGLEFAFPTQTIHIAREEDLQESKGADDIK